MFRFTLGRMVAAASVFIGLILLLPRISSAWVNVLGAAAMELSDGTAAAISPGASVLLPIVCGALVAAELPLARRLFWLGAVFVVTFGAELTLVALWAATGLPASWALVPENVVLFLFPMAVLAIAMSETRVESS